MTMLKPLPTVEATVSSSALPTGAAEEATQLLVLTDTGLMTADLEDIRVAIENLDSKWVPDGGTNALLTIDYAHHERHSGRNYEACKIKATDTSLILAFKVGDQTREAHLTLRWRTEETASLIVYEGRTWTGGTGSAVVPINSNRNSANESILEGDSTGAFVANRLVLDPTGQGAGTSIHEDAVWGTNQAPAGSSEKRNEIILKPDTQYSVEITAANGGIYLCLDWYEHAPGGYTP